MEPIHHPWTAPEFKTPARPAAMQCHVHLRTRLRRGGFPRPAGTQGHCAVRELLRKQLQRLERHGRPRR